MSALARAHARLTEAVAELEQAKSEVPDIALEGLVFARVETKVLRRRIENLAKAIGDPVP